VSGFLTLQLPERNSRFLFRLLFSDKASDVIIVCGGGTDRIPAHRVILMAQSSFFEAAFSVNMKVQHSSQIEHCLFTTETDVPQENLEGIIDLPESTAVIRSILSYLYTNEYDAAVPYLMHQLEVYVAADKYDIPALKSTAARHAVAYLDAAECNFKRMTAPDLGTMTVSGTALSTVIQYIYSNTLDGGNILRQKLVSIVRNSLPAEQTDTEHEAWAQLFGAVPSFAVDLLISRPPSLKSHHKLRRTVSLCYGCAKDSEWWSGMMSKPYDVDYSHVREGDSEVCGSCKSIFTLYRIFLKIT
jgi:hypothetical protein